MTDANMELWDQVCETDPGATKKVAQRGGFTAICAHSQVRRATEIWGPCGLGWGYNPIHEVIEVGSDLLAVCDVTLWHYPQKLADDKPPSIGPIRGCCLLLSKGRVDTDAPKKAMTDALTKGLSHWGFNADVFLGKYDDNKYVDEMREKFAGPTTTSAPKPAAAERPQATRAPDEFRAQVQRMLEGFDKIGYNPRAVLGMANSGPSTIEDIVPGDMPSLKSMYTVHKKTYDRQHGEGQ